MSGMSEHIVDSTAAADDFDPFAGGAVERVIPTTEAQREVWLADRLGVDASLAFNESVSLHLRGPIDLEALRGAVRRLVARHELLRASVSPDGGELVVSASSELPLGWVDVGASGGLPHEALAAAAARAVAEPFSLEQGGLFRAELHRLTIDHHVLLMTAHHIVCDGWSWAVLVEDLGQLYAELMGEAPEPDAPSSYADYVRWELAESTGAAMAAHESYWLNRYAGQTLPTLDLPTDRPRAALRQFDSARLDHVWDAAFLADLRRTGARQGASLVATLFAGWAVLLSRLSGQTDLVVGVPAAGQAASGLHRVVGHCVNLLPVRIEVDPAAPFAALLAQSAGHLLDASEHQALGYGALLKKLPVERDPSRLPLASVMFNLDQALDTRALAFPNIQAELVGNPRARENFELFVNAVQVDGGLRVECQYNTALFDEATVSRWLDSWQALLRGAVSALDTPVGRLPWLTASQQAALRALQPAPVLRLPDERLQDAIVAQAASAKGRVALVGDDATLTYGELDARANQIAQVLRSTGVGRGDRVGLCLPRGAEMVVALLGVLKTGAAYVPLDPGFPKARLDYYAADAGLAQLLTRSDVNVAPRLWQADAAARIVELDTDPRLPTASRAPLEDVAVDGQGEDAAYVIYTSGSTGQPKGVVVPHRAAVNFLGSMRLEPGLGPDEVMAAVTTLSFDIAVLELLLPLTVGAQVVVVPRETAMDGTALARLLVERGATVMQATPGQWRILIDAGWTPAQGFRAFVGGEALPRDLALTLAERCASVWNLYGPTETTVWSTVWPVTAAAVSQSGVSIGRPIDNTTIWIVDDQLQPCPPGVPGEICIGGAGLALGYHQRPELTAERFVHVPELGALYRTGDRGRWRNDGLLEHLGRLDFQVKVRGYRIELGEIEAGCVGTAGVGQAVVLAREFGPADVRLVAYVVAAPAAQVDVETLASTLRERLPDYMLPQHVQVLDRLPLLPNGKVDRKALPLPERSAAPAADRRAPASETERKVLAHLEAVLNLPGLGVDDNFFALGGHSLLAARLTTRLNREFDRQLPLVALFGAPTAARLAALIDGPQAAARSAGIRHEAAADQMRAPLTPMQQRICFVQAMHPDRVLYNTPSAHRLRGAFHADAFAAALRDVVLRQPALRTRIDVSHGLERAEQVVESHVDLALPVIDLSAWPLEDREAELRRRMQAIIDTPMALDAAPLFRAALYRLSAEEHAFFFMPHHVVWDGWSFDVLYDDLSTAYAARVLGQAPAWTPLALSYGDHARWLERWLASEDAEAQRRFWQQRFLIAPEVRALPAQFARRPGMSGEGATEWVHVDRGLTERLREVARAGDATLNMLALTVYAAMLTDLDRRDTVVLGMPVRGRELPALESVMGFFNNLLPLHVQVDRARSAREQLAALKAPLLDVMAHQTVPFEQVAALPEVAARTQGAGLYQALFSFQDARERQRRWGGLQHEAILVFQKGATEDLGLWLMEVPGGLEGGITYNADLYSPELAAALRDRYVELLERVASSPDAPLGSLLEVTSKTASRLQAWLTAAEAPPVALDATAAVAVAEAAPPVTAAALDPAEQALAEIWASLLSIPVSSIRATDNFFDLGGDSLLAMRAIERTRTALGHRVEPRRYVFESLSQLVAGPAAEPAAPVTPEAKPRGLMAGVLSVFGRKSKR